mmetsp:Transcript_19988/g.63591  ORF Transcript_19988/g.63591 Transcript_19988/m.63591 type:complete len:235 (-) Transcript_19988:3261-3965(-)
MVTVPLASSAVQPRSIHAWDGSQAACSLGRLHQFSQRPPRKCRGIGCLHEHATLCIFQRLPKVSHCIAELHRHCSRVKLKVHQRLASDLAVPIRGRFRSIQQLATQGSCLFCFFRPQHAMAFEQVPHKLHRGELEVALHRASRERHGWNGQGHALVIGHHGRLGLVRKDQLCVRCPRSQQCLQCTLDGCPCPGRRTIVTGNPQETTLHQVQTLVEGGILVHSLLRTERNAGDVQ